MKIHRFKQFKVVSVSSNRNSFGLSGMILMGRDGTAWQVGANTLNLCRKGDIVNVPIFGRRTVNHDRPGRSWPGVSPGHHCVVLEQGEAVAIARADHDRVVDSLNPLRRGRSGLSAGGARAAVPAHSPCPDGAIL